MDVSAEETGMFFYPGTPGFGQRLGDAERFRKSAIHCQVAALPAPLVAEDPSTRPCIAANPCPDLMVEGGVFSPDFAYQALPHSVPLASFITSRIMDMQKVAVLAAMSSKLDIAETG